MTKSCSREPDTLEAVLAGRMPDELRAHTATCAACGEVARVASLVHDDFSRVLGQANVPTADVVWVRAQIRAREDAAQTAARPILVTQAVALAALIGLLISLAGKLSLRVWTWPAFADIPLQVLLPLGVALGCWIIFAPVALYFAFSRD